MVSLAAHLATRLGFEDTLAGDVFELRDHAHEFRAHGLLDAGRYVEHHRHIDGRATGSTGPTATRCEWLARRDATRHRRGEKLGEVVLVDLVELTRHDVATRSLAGDFRAGIPAAADDFKRGLDPVDKEDLHRELNQLLQEHAHD